MTDSKSLSDALDSTKSVLEKCVSIDIALLKEFIDNKSITKILYVPTQNQLPNKLIKKEHHQSNFLIRYPKEFLHFNPICQGVC